MFDIVNKFFLFKLVFESIVLNVVRENFFSNKNKIPANIIEN